MLRCSGARRSVTVRRSVIPIRLTCMPPWTMIAQGERLRIVHTYEPSGDSA